MAGAATADDKGTFQQKIVALLVVVVFALIGWIFLALFRGFTIPFTKKKVKALCTTVQIPPLVGMIVMGAIARNFLGDFMEFYPNNWAHHIRTVCLSVILLRGGLELDFRGKGVTVVLLTLCPQICEAIGAAALSRIIFGMPWALCFANGFTLAAVSPAVVVPSMMHLHTEKYGVKKGVPTTLIAASSFDDIIAITVFGVCKTIAFREAPGGVAEENDSIGKEVGINVGQIVAGLAVGLGVGWCMRVFNKCHKPGQPNKCLIWVKFFVCLAMAFAVPIVCEITKFYESKFICIIFFGYMCYMGWGEDKPEHHLAIFWGFCQPFLFGTVGAAVLFSKLDSSVLGTSLIVILFGVTCRWIATVVVTFEKKFNYKERMFMGFAWIPKATVQAALGGMVLAQSQAEGISSFEEFGNIMLTCAVFAVVITAPAGAIFINTLGTKWLEYDADAKVEPIEGHGHKNPEEKVGDDKKEDAQPNSVQ